MVEHVFVSRCMYSTPDTRSMFLGLAPGPLQLRAQNDPQNTRLPVIRADVRPIELLVFRPSRAAHILARSKELSLPWV